MEKDEEFLKFTIAGHNYYEIKNFFKKYYPDVSSMFIWKDGNENTYLVIPDGYGYSIVKDPLLSRDLPRGMTILPVSNNTPNVPDPKMKENKKMIDLNRKFYISGYCCSTCRCEGVRVSTWSFKNSRNVKTTPSSPY